MGAEHSLREQARVKRKWLGYAARLFSGASHRIVRRIIVESGQMLQLLGGSKALAKVVLWEAIAH
jgi:hypothetical protein